MADLDNLKDKYEGKKDGKQTDSVKSLRSLQKELEGKKDSAPVRAVKQAVSGFRSQWSGIDDQGKVGVGKGVPGIYYDTVAIPALAGIVDDKYAPEFAVEADKKAGRIREAIRKDMGIEAPRGALEHFANAGGTMLGQLPVPGAWLKRVLTPVKEAGIAGKVAASPIEYLSPIVDPKKINYGVGTGFGGTIGTVGEMLEEDPVKKALGGLIQKYEDGGKVGKVKSFFSAVDKAIDTLKQKKGTGEQILKEIEKAPGVKKEELELRNIREKLKDKKSITQDEVRALAAESPAPNIKPIIRSRDGVGLPEDWRPTLDPLNQAYLDVLVDPVVDPAGGRNLGFLVKESGEIVDYDTLFDMRPEEFGVSKGTYNEMMIAAKKTKQQFDRALSQEDAERSPKFEKYTTPGGENYREILLQLDKSDPDFEKQITDLFGGTKNIDDINAGMIIQAGGSEELADQFMKYIGQPYRGGHFDEPNVLVHARVTDRTGPNGEKVLYVEEIQSDWHQEARKQRDRAIEQQLEKERPILSKKAKEALPNQDVTDENIAALNVKYAKLAKQRRDEIAKEMPKDVGYAKPLSELGTGMSADDFLWEHGDKLSEPQKNWLRDYIERWELDVDGTPAGQAAQDQLVKEYDDWLSSNSIKGVPDAPFKSTASELAVKQILDMAANEGYDTVAFSPGSEHVKRYGMSQYMDTLTGKKDASGLIELSGIKNDRPVVSKKGIKPEELADYVGKEKAERILADLENSNEFMLSGQDLEMTTKEGAGKKKIYDEIIPNYVRKYTQKEFGAEPGEIDIFTKQGKSYEQYLDEIVDDPYRYIDEDEYFETLNTRVTNRAAQQGYDLEDPEKWDELMARQTNEADDLWAEVENEFYEEKAKELANKDKGGSLRAFAVPVTPQMREKITGEGQKLFAAAPVAGVQTIPGMEEAPQQAAPVAEPEPEVEEAPMPFQSGGQAMATPRSELEEDPFVQTVLNAAKHYQGGKEIEAGQMGFRKGPVTVGVNAANVTDPGTRDQMQAQALFAAYRDRLGNVDVNAAVNRPAQAPDGFYQGNIMASTPVGPGRAMAGVSGYKSPQKTDVSGYNFGYEQKVGPGYASGMVFQPKDRRQDTRYDVQYTIPFQSGGPVGLQSGGRVGSTRAAADKLMRVLHGSPTRITPESGKAIDVTTEPSYAVKRGTDKMLGKSGPPMVNQFDVPAGKILQFEEQYSPEDVALMRRYFNKLPQGQAMSGEDIFDAAQGRDAILEGIAKAGGFSGYERPNTGAVGKGQWFRITEPEELIRKARGGLAQFLKPL